MSHFTGKNGILRLHDSAAGEDLSQAAPIEVRISHDSGGHTDVTSDLLDRTAGVQTVLGLNTDFLYVGLKFPFNVLEVDVSVAAVGAGALTVEYWDGGSWTSVSNLSDGTASTGTLEQDGNIKWDLPSDWATNDPPTSGTSLYYVRLSTATSASTDPQLEYIDGISGQFYEVLFVQMDFTGPLGRSRPEEVLNLDRGNLTSNAFYHQGPDDPILEPVDISWSCLVDEGVNRQALFDALSVGVVGTANWPNAGVSSKGDSSLVAGAGGSVTIPVFADASKKAINVQLQWVATTADDDVSLTYNEVYFPPEDINIAESEDVLTMSVTGKCYGTIVVDFAPNTQKYFGNLQT